MGHLLSWALGEGFPGLPGETWACATLEPLIPQPLVPGLSLLPPLGIQPQQPSNETPEPRKMKAYTLEKGKAKGHGVHGILSAQGWSRRADLLEMAERERERKGLLCLCLLWPFSDTLNLYFSPRISHFLPLCLKISICTMGI